VHSSIRPPCLRRPTWVCLLRWQSHPRVGGRWPGKLGLDERGARLLLDACVTLGLLEKLGDLYRNTSEAAALLVPSCPGDLSRAIRYNRDVYGAWAGVAGLVRTGRRVELPELHLGNEPDRTRTFVLSMQARALGVGRGLLPFLDLSRNSRCSMWAADPALTPC